MSHTVLYLPEPHQPAVHPENVNSNFGTGLWINHQEINNAMMGYAHPWYSCALSEFGEPIRLKTSAGWLLRRTIGNTGSYDTMSPYPLFSCQNWNGLASDLEALGKELVSVAMVPDP